MMNSHLTNSMFLGGVRTFLATLFLYMVYRLYKQRAVHLIDFIAKGWFVGGGVLVVSLFAFIQLGIYNLINILIWFTLLFFGLLVSNSALFTKRTTLKKVVTSKVVAVVERLTEQRAFISCKQILRRWGRVEQGTSLLLLAIIVVITIGGRLALQPNNYYALGDTWFQDLQKVKQIGTNEWLSTQVDLPVQWGLINFYAAITDTSHEMALTACALLQAVLLSVLIYWVVKQCTPSKVGAPLVAALLFASGFVVLPFNLHFLLQPKGLFFALSIFLPTVTLVFDPSVLKLSRQQSSMLFIVGFLAIGLLDLFTFLILVPLVFIVGILVLFAQNKVNLKSALLAFSTAFALLFFYIGYLCAKAGQPITSLVETSLINVSSYTFLPQLILPLEITILAAKAVVYSGVVLFFILYFLHKMKSALGLLFLLYTFLLLNITTISPWPWLDKDLLHEALLIFIPIAAGITLGLLGWFGKLLLPAFAIPRAAIITIVGSVAAYCLHRQAPILSRLEQTAPVNKEILLAYDKINQSFFPFSYAVVNEHSFQAIGKMEHFFINYEDFLYTYPRQDSLYFLFRKNKYWLDKNPQISLPKSVLLFVYSKNLEGFPNGDNLGPLLHDQISNLRAKGRRIELFYSSRTLRVYEIINEPGQSKIHDLIF